MSNLPTDAKERKAIPIGTGVLDYFPNALAEVAKVSKVGNDQHNPGEPLHWAKEKSTDESDAMIRHYLDRYKKDGDGTYHAAKMCWRALAFLERLLTEQDRSPDVKDTPPIPQLEFVPDAATVPSEDDEHTLTLVNWFLTDGWRVCVSQRFLEEDTRLGVRKANVGFSYVVRTPVQWKENSIGGNLQSTTPDGSQQDLSYRNYLTPNISAYTQIDSSSYK